MLDKEKMESDLLRINDYYDKCINKLLDFKSLGATYVDIKNVDTDKLTPEELEIFSKARIEEKHDLISDLFISIANIQVDLNICHRNLLIAKVTGREYEEIYFARALATHCFELFKTENSDKLLTRIKAVGSEFHNQPEYETALKELKELRKSLLDEYKANQTYIDTLRNKLFAHRETKGIEEHNSIKDIDVEPVAFMSERVDLILHNITGKLLEIQTILTPPDVQYYPSMDESFL